MPLNHAFIAPSDASEAQTIDRFAGIVAAEIRKIVPQVAPGPPESPPGPPSGGPADLGLELLEAPDPRHDRLVIRCTPEFHAWTAGLADWMGVSLTSILEQSLRRMAEGSGFPQLPPRRYRPSSRPRRRPS